MRVVDEDLDAEVAGTSVGDTIEAVAWRGDAAPVVLDVESWSISWDASRQIQGQAALTVADPEHDLFPWSMGGLLAPGGSRVALAWISGMTGLRVPLGTWRVRRSDPDVQFRVMGAGGAATPIASGGRVTVALDEDCMATPLICRMDAERVRSGTRLGEVRRMLSAVGVPVDVQGVDDASAPSSLVYEDGRMDAVEDHLSHLDAVYRGGPDGAFEVLPRAGGASVWQIAGGEYGALVRVSHTLSDESVYNAVVSRGESPTGRQLVGRAFLTSGPLAWGGPFGQVPMFHQSPATSLSGVDQDADSLMANRVAAAEVTLAVSCLFHPALQLHDMVTVLAPTDGAERAIVGRVVSMSARSISGSGSTPAKGMDLGVAVPVDVLEMVAARIGRGQ